MARGLTPTKRKFAVEYATGVGITEAGNRAGISPPTAGKYARDPDVLAHVDKIQREIELGMIRHRRASIGKLNDRLMDLAYDQNPSVSLKACIYLLDSMTGQVVATEEPEWIKQIREVE